MLTAPLAYKYVFVAVILAEINYCASRLELPIKQPVTKEDITFALVVPPFDHRVRSPFDPRFESRFDTEHYSFCSGPAGRIRFIINIDDIRGGRTLRQYQEDLGRLKSTIGTNEAYRIASNWLASIDVDMKRLEREHRPTTKQQSFVSWTNNKVEVPLPIFEVKWGDWNDPTVQVRISGTDGKLLRLRQEDDSYSGRPTNLIRNIDQLLAIPDEEFLKYSPAERSNLVARFSLVKYARTNRTTNSTSSTTRLPEKMTMGSEIIAQSIASPTP